MIFHTFKDDFYWSAENSRGEIDFLVQDEERIIPIEVKAEENLQAKSLRVFVERNQGLKGIDENETKMLQKKEHSQGVPLSNLNHQ